MTSIVWMVAVIGTQGFFSLLTLWLRLRWEVQQQERHPHLAAIVRALPEGGEIDAGQSDGTWLRLIADRPWTS